MFDLEKGFRVIDELKRENETLREVEYKKYGDFNDLFKELLKNVEEKKKLLMAS